MRNPNKLSWLIALLLAVSSCDVCAKETFKEEFANNNQGWELDDDAVIADKELKLTSHKDLSKTLIYQRLRCTDADITASVRLDSANETDANSGAGIVFWAQDLQNYYFFLIRPDGKYMIGRWVGRFLSPVPTTADASIKGPGEWNQLRVEFKDDKATFYCNGIQLRTLTGQAPTAGSWFGFIAEDGQTAPTCVAYFKGCTMVYRSK